MIKKRDNKNLVDEMIKIGKNKKNYNKPVLEYIGGVNEFTKGANDANSADGGNFFIGNAISQN